MAPNFDKVQEAFDAECGPGMFLVGAETDGEKKCRAEVKYDPNSDAMSRSGKIKACYIGQ